MSEKEKTVEEVKQPENEDKKDEKEVQETKESEDLENSTNSKEDSELTDSEISDSEESESEKKSGLDILLDPNFDELDYEDSELVTIYKSALHEHIVSTQELKDGLTKKIEDTQQTVKQLLLKEQQYKQSLTSSAALIKELKENFTNYANKYVEMTENYENEQKEHNKTLSELHNLETATKTMITPNMSMLAALEITVKNGKIEGVAVKESLDAARDDAMLKIQIMTKKIEELQRQVTSSKIEVAKTGEEIEKSKQSAQDALRKNEELTKELGLTGMQVKMKDDEIEKLKKAVDELKNRERALVEQNERVKKVITSKNEIIKATKGMDGGGLSSAAMLMKQNLLKKGKEEGKQYALPVVKMNEKALPTSEEKCEEKKSESVKKEESKLARIKMPDFGKKIDTKLEENKEKKETTMPQNKTPMTFGELMKMGQIEKSAQVNLFPQQQIPAQQQEAKSPFGFSFGNFQSKLDSRLNGEKPETRMERRRKRHEFRMNPLLSIFGVTEQKTIASVDGIIDFGISQNGLIVVRSTGNSGEVNLISTHNFESTKLYERDVRMGSQTSSGFCLVNSTSVILYGTTEMEYPMSNVSAVGESDNGIVLIDYDGGVCEIVDGCFNYIDSVSFRPFGNVYYVERSYERMYLFVDNMGHLALYKRGLCAASNPNTTVLAFSVLNDKVFAINKNMPNEICVMEFNTLNVINTISLEHPVWKLVCLPGLIGAIGEKDVYVFNNNFSRKLEYERKEGDKMIGVAFVQRNGQIQTVVATTTEVRLADSMCCQHDFIDFKSSGMMTTICCVCNMPCRKGKRCKQCGTVFHPECGLKFKGQFLTQFSPCWGEKVE
ncbi:myosin heavy chain, clone, putative [Entamoeba invadens IP1]|uniref:myosin heavy chain, clone, putative n=1 Tax=Entamoeba invadens IP1 TaxID=370355 RepID=UPI0002C3EBA6|nr:myosin heavy chain, clone, putative [Entamoeba invadens IP1]ELP93298.1 myosin heavy chain, clone, putative [Entamoeba invadens IP1]|eukprot:XP_004260069.1 myosin heavy chain, clone, putative [Entamoeba invadens IP1]